MKVLIIFAHHRPNSLTGQIKDNFERGLKEAGHQVDTLDLHKLDWEPIMNNADEPDYNSKGEQYYSEEVKGEQARLLQYEAISFVFPTYWWGMPAILKGYLDRVLGYQFAYGSKKYLKDSVKKMLFLTLTGSNATQMYETSRFNEVLDYIYNVGIAGFCQIESSRVAKFVDAKSLTEERAKALFDQAYKEGLDF